jgi:hypothetical protein
LSQNKPRKNTISASAEETKIEKGRTIEFLQGFIEAGCSEQVSAQECQADATVSFAQQPSRFLPSTDPCSRQVYGQCEPDGLND